MLGMVRLPARAVIAGMIAAAAPVLVLAAPAQAATGAHGGGFSSVRARAVAVADSASFAGYEAAVTAGSATTSTAQFKAPGISCPSSAFLAITPVAGVAVNKNATYSSAFIVTGCQNGKAFAYPALVVNGKEVNYTGTSVAAGNVIRVSASVTTKGTTVEVTDVTKKVTEKRTGAGASTYAAYMGDSDWRTRGGTLVGVPDFGTLSFTHCLVDGSALGSRKPAGYQRVTSQGVVQIATGTLTSGGTAFATTYKHS